MPNAVYVAAPLLIGLVLVTSAVGKLRAPERARAAFSALGLPRVLDRPWSARAHPWAEIALALMIMVVPGPVGVIAAGAAVALMLVYVALVVRALRSPVDVDCACFGALGGDRITRATVWRNVWLTAVGAAALWASLGLRSPVSRLAGLSAADWWWLVAAGATGLTVALVLWPGQGQGSEAGQEVPEGDIELADYVRTRTPAVPITLADGSTTDLRRLSAQRAQLLLYVSEGCSGCQNVIAAAPQWRVQLPQLEVRLLVAVRHDISSLTATVEPMSLHDPQRMVWESFGLWGTPSALLLGTDGLLAGGPVMGADAVFDFVTEIRHELGSVADTAATP